MPLLSAIRWKGRLCHLTGSVSCDFCIFAKATVTRKSRYSATVQDMKAVQQRTQRGLAVARKCPIAYQEASLSGPATIHLEESVHYELLALKDLQPVYTNVNPDNTNWIGSHIQSIQNTNGNEANSPRMHWKNKEPVVIYSELKARPDEFAEQTSRRESAREDTTEDYENVSSGSAATGH
ncbi:Fc receptor-like protein 3 [Fukomys damarensis]|uniref:Fc receptor-like protein 3 n=1 Tax=Fukomys damarensis TaxID=885580 RepID=UPI0014555ECE|nr:Fc receptor-like protein 3 [Fukomys damarensis]